MSSTPCPEEHPAPGERGAADPLNASVIPLGCMELGCCHPPTSDSCSSGSSQLLTPATFPSVAMRAVLQVFSRVFEAGCKTQGSSVGLE